MRHSPLKLFHVVAGNQDVAQYPGFQRAQQLAADLTPVAAPWITPDPVYQELREFRRQHVFVGPHNESDVERGFAKLDFLPTARPLDAEGVARDSYQLYALCREAKINHLIYMGFAINWCLLTQPGGMIDMSRMGMMCSAFRQAVTAVENKETARGELNKEEGLWRTALNYGFVFDVDPFIDALQGR